MRRGEGGVVRGAVAADVNDVCRLATAFATSFAVAAPVLRASFATLLDERSAHLLVVTVDATVSGYLLGFDHPTFYANGPVAWLEELMVDTAHRGNGLGRQLMDEFERRATARGCRLVALATRRADGFYRRLGYAESAAYLRKLLPPTAGAG